MGKSNDARLSAMELQLGIQTPGQRRQSAIDRMMRLWNVDPADLAAVASVEATVAETMRLETQKEKQDV